MNAIWTIARKELSDSFRNRWLVAISLVFATLALGIAWFGAAASGQVGYASTPATIASLASLGIFLIPLIALLLAYDAIVGEEEGGTLLLLMTYPLSKSQLLLGKFLGHGLTLALAADWRVSGDNAKFGATEILAGLPPAGDGAVRLADTIGSSKARDLVFSGRFVDAREALELGLVDQLVAPDTVYDAAVAWASRFLDYPPSALAAAKAAFGVATAGR